MLQTGMMGDQFSNNNVITKLNQQNQICENGNSILTLKTNENKSTVILSKLN